MAWRGVGYWALVALPLTLNFTQMVVSWMMVHWKPGLPRRDAKVGSMVAFGGKVSASYLILNMNRSLDNVLIGWYWGAAPLGLYSRAYNLLMLPVRQLSVPASSVTIPAFSRLQDEPERFARYYLRAIGLIIWITAPFFGFLFVAAKPVIVLVLGAKWGNAATVFQILVISALGQLLLESTVWLFVSRGQSKRLLRLLFVISPIIVGSFVVGLPFGIRGVALAGSLVLLIILPGILKFAFQGTTLTFRRLGEALIWPISLSLGAVLCSELALHISRPEYLFWQLLVPTLGFMVVFSLSTILPSVRAELMSFRRLLSNLRPASNTG
jgi:PST family polysaccharide transporter